MSADNWAICPKCKANAEKSANAAAAKARQAYGKVPLEEYQEMVDAADKIANQGLKDTLREDYALGITADGKFEVIYTGRCGTCGFAHTFRHSESVIEGGAK